VCQCVTKRNTQRENTQKEVKTEKEIDIDNVDRGRSRTEETETTYILPKIRKNEWTEKGDREKKRCTERKKRCTMK
jgi:hypothetical protein